MARKVKSDTLTLLSQAEAEAEAAYLQGQGIARQRQAIVNGLRESVVNFEGGVKVSPQEVIELMMVSSSAHSLE